MTLTIDKLDTSHWTELSAKIAASGLAEVSWLPAERELVDFWTAAVEAGPALSGRQICPELDGNPFDAGFLDKVIDHALDNLEGAELTTIWQSWLRLQKTVEVQRYARALPELGPDFVKQFGREMTTAFPKEEAALLPDRDKLETAVAAFLVSWADKASSLSAERASWEAIRLFHKHLTAEIKAPLQYWQILVAPPGAIHGRFVEAGKRASLGKRSRGHRTHALLPTGDPFAAGNRRGVWRGFGRADMDFSVQHAAGGSAGVV